MEPAKPQLAEAAGYALIWRGTALLGEKLIFLARMLIVARLVAPEEFGLVAIAMTVLTVVSQLTDFGLVSALVQSPTREKGHLDTAWTISVSRGFVINIFLLIFAPFIADLFAEPRATNMIRALAVATLAQSAASIEIAAITRALHFRALGSILLASALINTIVAITLAKSMGAWALILGSIAGAVTHMIGSYIAAPYRPRLRMAGAAMHQLMQYGRWIFLTGVITVMFHAVLRWMISVRLGVAELGIFFLASRLAFLPSQVTTGVLYDVAFPVYAQLQHNEKKLQKTFRAMLISLLALLLPLSMIFLVMVPGLVDNVLGDRWSETTEIIQILIIASLAGILGDCLSPLLKGTGRPEKITGISAFRLLILAAVSWSAIGAMGLIGAGLGYLASMIASQILVLLILNRILVKPFSRLLRPAIAILVAGLAGTAATFLIIGAVPGLTGLVIGAVAGGLVCLAAGLAIDHYWNLGILETVSEPFPRIAAIAGKLFRRN